MIMNSIIGDPQHEKKDSFFDRVKPQFRTTSLAIRKITNRANMTRQPSKQQSELSLSPKRTPTYNPQSYESTCSNFLKSYMDKLKRQHKRERKKLSISSQNRQIQPSITYQVAPLPLIDHGKTKLLLLQKINPQSFRPAINPPQIASHTLYNDHFTQMIREMREQREQIERHPRKKLLPMPWLDQKQILPRQNHIDKLDPWEGQTQHHEYGFQ